MTDFQPISLSSEFNQILDELEHSNSNYFITGRAGTGKSTLLQLFRNTTKKKCIVLAPTGIAALNVRGQTIHSFFGFPPKMINPNDINRRKNNKLYKNIDTIIIDEISMVRADMIDNIDHFLRINRNIDKTFGNVQMIFFGDLFQLPPVVATPFEKNIFSTIYQNAYFFSAHIFNQQNCAFQMIELKTVYRQNDKHFIKLLDAFRQNNFDDDHIEQINQRFVPLPQDQQYIITLTSRKNIANAINQQRLNEIDSKIFTYNAKIIGNFDTRIFPTEYTLKIKVGAQVMFVKNDTHKRFVNGTIGKITDLDSDTIKVNIYNNQKEREETIEIEKQDWEIVKYKFDNQNPKLIKSEIVGTFIQYPIKLAWAITIHKSQGKTFDSVIIDLGNGAFEYGQAYVALSRCRSLQGVFLKKPLQKQDILIDNTVSQWYKWKQYNG